MACRAGEAAATRALDPRNLVFDGDFHDGQARLGFDRFDRAVFVMKMDEGHF